MMALCVGLPPWTCTPVPSSQSFLILNVSLGGAYPCFCLGRVDRSLKAGWGHSHCSLWECKEATAGSELEGRVVREKIGLCFRRGQHFSLKVDRSTISFVKADDLGPTCHWNSRGIPFQVLEKQSLGHIACHTGEEQSSRAIVHVILNPALLLWWAFTQYFSPSKRI